MWVLRQESCLCLPPPSLLPSESERKRRRQECPPGSSTPHALLHSISPLFWNSECRRWQEDTTNKRMKAFSAGPGVPGSLRSTLKFQGLCFHVVRLLRAQDQGQQGATTLHTRRKKAPVLEKKLVPSLLFYSTHKLSGSGQSQKYSHFWSKNKRFFRWVPFPSLQKMTFRWHGPPPPPLIANGTASGWLPFWNAWPGHDLISYCKPTLPAIPCRRVG